MHTGEYRALVDEKLVQQETIWSALGRPRTLIILSIAAFSAISVVTIFFVKGQDDRIRNDAMIFLTRFDDVDLDAEFDTQAANIARLEALPLASEDIDQIRALCVRAYRTLLEAEEHSNSARERLTAEVEARGAGATLPESIQAEIQREIDNSGAALSRAQELIPSCTDQVETLNLRYRPRSRRANSL